MTVTMRQSPQSLSASGPTSSGAGQVLQRSPGRRQRFGLSRVRLCGTGHSCALSQGVDDESSTGVPGGAEGGSCSRSWPVRSPLRTRPGSSRCPSRASARGSGSSSKAAGLGWSRRGRAHWRCPAGLAAAGEHRDRPDPTDQAGDRQRRRIQRRGVRPVHRRTPRAAALRLAQIRAPLPRPRADSHRRRPLPRGRDIPRRAQRDPATRPSASTDRSRCYAIPRSTRSTSIKPEILCQKLDAGQPQPSYQMSTVNRYIWITF